MNAHGANQGKAGMNFLEEAEKIRDEVIGWRRKIHAYPELRGDEHKTAELVATLLKEFGVKEIHEGASKTGVVAVVPGAPGGKTVALRADMDALRIEEENDLPFKSTRPGLMHACGHDAHTAMLLGAAKIISSLPEPPAANVKLVFQPAEEGGEKIGGEQIVGEGWLDGVDISFALHIDPLIESRAVSVLTGPEYAAADRFIIEVLGKGGHGALPHKAIDP
ncbi:unnamed protein product, partial [marine sediment metagenome]